VISGVETGLRLSKIGDICSILGLVIAIPLAIIAVREWMKNEALSMNWGLFWISFIALLMFAAGALQVGLLGLDTGRCC
jgi:uncharacterized protein with PQ loop repeat